MTKSIFYFAKRKTSKLLAVSFLIAGTSLFALPYANADQVSATVVCSDGTNEQSFQIGWDNSNQFFADRGSISHLFCEGGYAGNYNTFINSTVSGSVDYYNGILPQPAPQPEATASPSPEASPSPTPTPEPSVSPNPTLVVDPVPSPSPSATETSTVEVTPSPTPTSQQETATASAEPTPTSTPEPSASPVPETPPTSNPEPQTQPQSQPDPEPIPSLTPEQIAATLAAQEAAAQLAEEQRIAEEQKIAEEQAAIAEEINDAIAQAIEDNGGEVPSLVVAEPEVLPLTEEEAANVPSSNPNTTEETSSETQPEPSAPSEPVVDTSPEVPAPVVVVEPVEVSVPSVTPSTPVDISTVDVATLPPDALVMLENGVVLTAEVVVSLELLGDPTELVSTLFTDPLAAFTALGNVGADLPPEVRKKAKKVVIAAVIAGNIATSAALTAASPAASYRRKP